MNIWPLFASLLLGSVVRAPLSWCESGWTAWRLRRQPFPRAPVFILGHWRSGTTHLFNTMSRDPQFAWPDPFATGLPWNFLMLAPFLRPLSKKLLPAGRFIDDVPVKPDSPQEDEIALASMQNVSYYHGIYFPRSFEVHFKKGVFLEGVGDKERKRWRRRFVYYNRKLLIGRADKTLLVKNPVYTGRVDLVREIWPDARFVHIHRNPYAVFESIRKFYRSLLPRFALQDYDDTLLENLILDTYPRMIEKLYKDTRDLKPSRFVELRFEDLERTPLVELERVYATLSIPGFPEVRPVLERYLGSISSYRKNKYSFGDETVKLVDRHWGELVRRWGYAVPR